MEEIKKQIQKIQDKNLKKKYASNGDFRRLELLIKGELTKSKKKEIKNQWAINTISQSLAVSMNKSTEQRKTIEILLNFMPRKYLIKALSELHDRRFKDLK